MNHLKGRFSSLFLYRKQGGKLMRKWFSILMLISLSIFAVACSSEINNAENTISNEYVDEVSAPESDSEPEAKPEQENFYLELNGRGISDIGREEPIYEGRLGFVAISSTEAESTKKPWKVHLVKQTGPETFEVTKQTIQHKTEVKVLKQQLKHRGHGFYEGFLVVESVEDKKIHAINVNNFVTHPYWEKPVVEAIKSGPIIAKYTGQGKKPVDKLGEWVNIKSGEEVIIMGKSGTNGYIPNGFVQGKYNNMEVHFDPNSLELVY
jgi:hypothetical protein